MSPSLKDRIRTLELGNTRDGLVLHTEDGGRVVIPARDVADLAVAFMESMAHETLTPGAVAVPIPGHILRAFAQSRPDTAEGSFWVTCRDYARQCLGLAGGGGHE